MFGRLLGEILAAPLQVLAVPTKVLRAVDDATLQTGVGEVVDDLAGEPLAETARKIKRELSDLDKP